MKHLKTFESYQSVNEEFIGKFLRNVYSKVKNAFKGWRDSLQKKAAMKFAELLDENKDDPKFQELLSQAKNEYDKLPQSDKSQLANVARQGELEEDMVRESRGINLVAKTLTFLGLSSAASGFIATVYQLVMHSKHIPGYMDITSISEREALNMIPRDFLMGLSFAEFGAIAGIALIGGGLIAGIGRITSIAAEERREIMFENFDDFSNFMTNLENFDNFEFDYSSECSIDVLNGKLVFDIVINKDKTEMLIVIQEGDEYEVYKFYHEIDCCEFVYLYDINGDLDDIIDEVLIQTDESTNEARPDEIDESGTWTFYKLATKKGYVTIRWLGESNGYYSEEVSLVKAKNIEYDELVKLYQF